MQMPEITLDQEMFRKFFLALHLIISEKIIIMQDIFVFMTFRFSVKFHLQSIWLGDYFVAHYLSVC